MRFFSSKCLIPRKYEQQEPDDPEFDVKTFDVGPLTVEDIDDAVKGQLAIINFDQKISAKVAAKIKNESVRLYDFDIIYDLFDHLSQGMAVLSPKKNSRKGFSHILKILKTKL